MLKGMFILDPVSYDLIYGQRERKRIGELVQLPPAPLTNAALRQDLKSLADIEVIFSGWGGPKIDETFLAAAPNLKMVFYGAGTIRGTVTDAFWDRGVRITSAYAINAIPVAEYSLAMIILGMKRAWPLARGIRRDGKYPTSYPVPGCYGTTVGLISMGMVARALRERLRAFDMRVIAYDPFMSKADAASLGVELVSLEKLFQRADVVSLHTPWLKETEGMITGAHFRSMKQDSTFINTARGAVVRETEMIEVLTERPDLFAVLDVTHPEPPKPGSPLYTLPNVVLTPHIAGSKDAECQRMGRTMAEELENYLAGKPLRWEITREKAKLLS